MVLGPHFPGASLPSAFDHVGHPCSPAQRPAYPASSSCLWFGNEHHHAGLFGRDVELGRAKTGAEGHGGVGWYVWRLSCTGYLHDARLLCKIGSVDCTTERVGACNEKETLRIAQRVQGGKGWQRFEARSLPGVLRISPRVYYHIVCTHHVFILPRTGQVILQHPMGSPSPSPSPPSSFLRLRSFPLFSFANLIGARFDPHSKLSLLASLLWTLVSDSAWMRGCSV